MSSLSLPTERRARLAALTRLHAAWENLWLASRGANPQWTARNAERSADEVRVRRPVLKMLREATRMFGTPDFLAQLGQRFWSRVGPKPDKAKKDPRVNRMVAAVTRALLAQLDENAMEKLRRGVVHELARAAERSESWTRDSLGLRPLPPWRSREGFRKQADWTDVEGVFVDQYPELVNEINGNLTTAVGSHAEQVSHTVVNATNPARPRPIGEISRDIRQQLPGMSVRRSNMIARTETARSYGRMTHEQYKRNGIERRRTLTAAGSPAATLSPVCAICIDMAAQGWNDMGSPFESRVSAVSADYAPYHPYCRCDTTGDVEGWLPPMEELPGELLVEAPVYNTRPEIMNFLKRNKLPLRPSVRQWEASPFSLKETQVLDAYKKARFQPVNSALRAGKTVDDVAVLDKAFTKVPQLKERVTVFRGIDDKLAKTLSQGTVVKDPAYLSTSFSEEMAASWADQAAAGRVGYVVEIRAPRNARGLFMETGVEGVDFVGAEREWLLPRGSSMRVTRVVPPSAGERGRIVMEMLA